MTSMTPLKKVVFAAVAGTIAAALVLPSPAMAKTSARAAAKTEAAAKPKLRMLWHEEFDGKRGLPPTVQTSTRKYDKKYNWTTEINGNPYNHERQYYTDDVVQFNKSGSIAHYAIEVNGKGSLAINAVKPQKKTATHRSTYPQDYCAYGVCEYVSGRMNTKGKLGFKYGQILARVKVPDGGGTWPALWLLGADDSTNNWPGCGEIDMLESATTANFYGAIVGTLHSWPDDGIGTTARYYPEAPDLYAGYHTIGLRWVPNKIEFMVDGKVYQSITKKEMTSEGNAVYVDSLGQTYNREWPFNKEFYMILNLAMGGFFGGDSSDDYKAPADSKGGALLVDWIRVYSVNGIGKVIRH